MGRAPRNGTLRSRREATSGCWILREVSALALPPARVSVRPRYGLRMAAVLRFRLAILRTDLREICKRSREEKELLKSW